MRMTLDLPQGLIRKAQTILRARTKKETIILGLQHVLRKDKIDGLLALRGRMDLKVQINRSRQRPASSF
jgi:hypothetical protein